MNKVLIIVTLLGLILMNGCFDTDPNDYEVTLEDGTELTCDDYRNQDCGLTLYGCNDGITYRCMTNVKVKEVPE